MSWSSPNIGPENEQHRIALAPFVHINLKTLFSLFTKEKINASGSAIYCPTEFHAFSVNPPKMFAFVDLMIVSVFETPSHLL